MDFAALRVLKLVHRHRSFSEAADVLGISQSVVSYTIDKLRVALRDPLFLRQGGGIVPTDRCTAALAEAERILDLYDGLIAPDDTDPARIATRFTLSGNYYERRWILPPLARRLRQVAPQADLVVVQAQTRGPKQLLTGEADVLLGPMRPATDGFYSRTLLRTDYVCVMDPGHPLAQAPLTLPDYVGARHVGIDYGRGWSSGHVTRLRALGHELRPAITVPSPAGLGDLILGTDLVATVPAPFARTLAPSLWVVPVPFAAPFEIALVWTARTHGSRLHQWFRGLIVAATRDSQVAGEPDHSA